MPQPIAGADKRLPSCFWGLEEICCSRASPDRCLRRLRLSSALGEGTTRMSHPKIHYKDCAPEDIRCLEQFEPEIRKAVAAKGLAEDVCWRAYVSKGQV